MPESEERRRRFPFDFEVRISGLLGGEPFSFRLTPEGLQTKGFEEFRRIVVPPAGSREREAIVDVVEEKEEVVVTGEVPGVEKEAIKLTGTENSLMIDAESPTRSYHKEVTLPAKVDPKTAKATYNNGVLQVRLKKLEKKGDSIPIE